MENETTLYILFFHFPSKLSIPFAHDYKIIVGEFEKEKRKEKKSSKKHVYFRILFYIFRLIDSNEFSYQHLFDIFVF